LRQRRLGLVDLDETLQPRAVRIDHFALKFGRQQMASRKISAGVNRIPSAGHHGRVRRNQREKPYFLLFFLEIRQLRKLRTKALSSQAKRRATKPSIAFFDRPRHFIDADYRICDRRVMKEQDQG
jgi:hypothetical protein